MMKRLTCLVHVRETEDQSVSLCEMCGLYKNHLFFCTFCPTDTHDAFLINKDADNLIAAGL